jgi:hypothetical protein
MKRYIRALGLTLPPIQWVPEALSLGVKRPGRKADHSPPSRAEVKNGWSYNFMAWNLANHRDNFTSNFNSREQSCPTRYIRKLAG